MKELLIREINKILKSKNIENELYTRYIYNKIVTNEKYRVVVENNIKSVKDIVILELYRINEPIIDYSYDYNLVTNKKLPFFKTKVKKYKK